MISPITLSTLPIPAEMGCSSHCSWHALDMLIPLYIDNHLWFLGQWKMVMYFKYISHRRLKLKKSPSQNFRSARKMISSVALSTLPTPRRWGVQVTALSVLLICWYPYISVIIYDMIWKKQKEQKEFASISASCQVCQSWVSMSISKDWPTSVNLIGLRMNLKFLAFVP